MPQIQSRGLVPAPGKAHAAHWRERQKVVTNKGVYINNRYFNHTLICDWSA